MTRSASPRRRHRIVPLVIVLGIVALGVGAFGVGAPAFAPPTATDPLTATDPTTARGGTAGTPRSGTAGTAPSATAGTTTAGTTTGGTAGASPRPGTPIQPAPPSRPSATAARRAALDERLDILRERAGIPGISVAILFPDGTTWLGQSGLADIASGRPVTADTAFAVASITKTFTAAVVLDLVEDGLIELDGLVRRYLPDLDLPMDERTTVRQLLDHTSGLRDYFLDPRIDRALLGATDASWTAERALDYVGAPSFAAGRGWRYSNTNYLVLGLLAEAVSGESMADLYRTRFLVPLDLRDTVYQPAGATDGPVATGYRFASGALTEPAIDLSDGSGITPFTSVVTAAAAAGGMASSADDVARWARALYAGTALEPATRAAMLGGVALTDALDADIPYGLGVQSIELDGRVSYGHSGRLLGSRSVVRHFPAERITIAVLTNQSRADPSTIARSLVRIALRPIERCGCTLHD